MEVFRELCIEADAETMAAAVEEMEKSLPEGWTRDTESEKRGSSFPFTRQRVVYCFACKKGRQRPAATLILTSRGDHAFGVSNIIPTEKHELRRAEYNSILQEFHDRILRPVATRRNLHSTLTEATAELERWMDEHTADLLRSFADCANKGTGSSHPHDRERWNAFLLAAHESDCRLDSATLLRWLVEEEKWPQEVTEQLASEYETARDVLSYAQSH